MYAFRCDVQRAGSGAYDEEFVARTELSGFDIEFGNTNL